MPSAEWARDAAAVWDIATPSRPGRLPGVNMAGFRQRAPYGIELPVVPHPSVTMGIDLGDSPLGVDETSGRQLRGSVVAGLAPAVVRVRGRKVECLQVRLSPTIAYSLLGAFGEPGGPVIALDDLWGRD